MEDYIKKSSAMNVIDTIIDMTRTYLKALEKIRDAVDSVEAVKFDEESEIDE